MLGCLRDCVQDWSSFVIRFQGCQVDEVTNGVRVGLVGDYGVVVVVFVDFLGGFGFVEGERCGGVSFV